MAEGSGRLSAEWRQALAAIAGIFVATRLVIVAVAICVELSCPSPAATRPSRHGRSSAA